MVGIYGSAPMHGAPCATKLMSLLRVVYRCHAPGMCGPRSGQIRAGSPCRIRNLRSWGVIVKEKQPRLPVGQFCHTSEHHSGEISKVSPRDYEGHDACGSLILLGFRVKPYGTGPTFRHAGSLQVPGCGPWLGGARSVTRGTAAGRTLEIPVHAGDVCTQCEGRAECRGQAAGDVARAWLVSDSDAWRSFVLKCSCYLQFYDRASSLALAATRVQGISCGRRGHR